MQVSRSDESPKRCPVLVVEDDAASRNALRLLLRHSGYEGRYAASVSEAMAQLPEGPCCVILDLMLPDGNGTEVVRVIKEYRSETPVCVLSSVQDLSRALAAGADEAIPKSTPLPEIVTILARLVVGRNGGLG